MHYKERLEKYISLLHEHTVIYSEGIKGIYYLPCDYWDGTEIPALETFLPFEEGGYWGGRKDSHAWFAFHVDRPENGIYRLKISTNISGWASENPQMLVYIDGKPKQGVDLNHLYVDIPSSCDVMLYAYTGPNVSKNYNFLSNCKIFASLPKSLPTIWMFRIRHFYIRTRKRRDMPIQSQF